VRIVNELDRCSKGAQDLLLTYLDRLPPDRVPLGTSNLQLDLLTERFQTRFQAVTILAPETESWPNPVTVTYLHPTLIAALGSSPSRSLT
jgi:hypothetical protein